MPAIESRPVQRSLPRHGETSRGKLVLPMGLGRALVTPAWKIRLRCGGVGSFGACKQQQASDAKPISQSGQSRRLDHPPALPVCPQLRTLSASIGMSQTCQKRKSAGSIQSCRRAGEERDSRYLSGQSVAERQRLAARTGSRRQRSFPSFEHGYKRRPLQGR